MTAVDPKQPFTIWYCDPVIYRLAIGFIATTVVALPASAAEPPFWQVFSDDWCLVASSEKKFCLSNATIKRSWRHGSQFEVANRDVGSDLVLSFQYFDFEENPEYDGVDESFNLITTKRIGAVVVKRYTVQLGDTPRSITEYITITEPSVFSIALAGGTEEIRNDFVDSFVVAWGK